MKFEQNATIIGTRVRTISKYMYCEVERMNDECVNMMRPIKTITWHSKEGIIRPVKYRIIEGGGDNRHSYR